MNPNIGPMLWRVGDILDFWEQLDWAARNEFTEVAFWTCAGKPGVWQGFDLWNAPDSDIDRLKRGLSRFAEVDLHAGVTLTGGVGTAPATGDLFHDEAVAEMSTIIRFAAEVGAKVVTVHADAAGECSAEARRARMSEVLGELDAVAGRAGVRLGVELTRDYDLVHDTALRNVGLTLDMGHVRFHNEVGLRDFGTMGGLIRYMGAKLFHVHVHDYDGKLDHLAIGAGNTDFREMLNALASVRYAGSLCLELNPDRVTPGGIVTSRDTLASWLRTTLDATGTKR